MKHIVNQNNRYEIMALNDMPCIYIDFRVDRSSVPSGLHLYELRDACDGIVWGISKGVLVNFMGTVLCKEEMPEEDGEIILREGDGWFTGDYLSLEDYQKAYEELKQNLDPYEKPKAAYFSPANEEDYEQFYELLDECGINEGYEYEAGAKEVLVSWDKVFEVEGILDDYKVAYVRRDAA